MKVINDIKEIKRTAILFAQLSEFEVLFEQLSEKLSSLESTPFKIWTLECLNHTIYLVLTDIGKAAAASATQYVITRFSVELIVNVGVVGALNRDLIPTQALIVKETRYLDVDMRLFGHKLGKLPGTADKFLTDRYVLKGLRRLFSKLEFAKVLTSDTFVTAKNPFLTKHKFASGNFLFDMELAAIGQICYRNKVPFIAVKVVSDHLSNKRNHQEYYNHLPLCNYKIASTVKRIVRYLEEHSS